MYNIIDLEVKQRVQK